MAKISGASCTNSIAKLRQKQPRVAGGRNMGNQTSVMSKEDEEFHRFAIQEKCGLGVDPEEVLEIYKTLEPIFMKGEREGAVTKLYRTVLDKHVCPRCECKTIHGGDLGLYKALKRHRLPFPVLNFVRGIYAKLEPGKLSSEEKQFLLLTLYAAITETVYKYAVNRIFFMLLEAGKIELGRNYPCSACKKDSEPWRRCKCLSNIENKVSLNSKIELLRSRGFARTANACDPQMRNKTTHLDFDAGTGLPDITESGLYEFERQASIAYLAVVHYDDSHYGPWVMAPPDPRSRHEHTHGPPGLIVAPEDCRAFEGSMWDTDFTGHKSGQ